MCVWQCLNDADSDWVRRCTALVELNETNINAKTTSNMCDFYKYGKDNISAALLLANI